MPAPKSGFMPQFDKTRNIEHNRNINLYLYPDFADLRQIRAELSPVCVKQCRYIFSESHF